MQKALSFGFALWLAICAPAGAQQAAQSPAVVQANALFEEYWEWTLVEYPEFATYFGDRRYQDRLRDESAAAVARRKTFYAEFRGRLAGIDARQLPAPTRTSLQVLRYRLDRFVALNKHYGTLPFGIYEAWAPVTQMGGIHLDLPQLASISRFDTVSDYEAYLKRLGAVPTSIVDLVARMEAAMAAGWLRPRPPSATSRSNSRRRCPTTRHEALNTSRSRPFPRTLPLQSNSASRTRGGKSSATRSFRPSGR
jgi:uncharacterized protein (DUF885 family)